MIKKLLSLMAISIVSITTNATMIACSNIDTNLDRYNKTNVVGINELNKYTAKEFKAAILKELKEYWLKDIKNINALKKEEIKIYKANSEAKENNEIKDEDIKNTFGSNFARLVVKLVIKSNTIKFENIKEQVQIWYLCK